MLVVATQVAIRSQISVGTYSHFLCSKWVCEFVLDPFDSWHQFLGFWRDSVIMYFSWLQRISLTRSKKWTHRRTFGIELQTSQRSCLSNGLSLGSKWKVNFYPIFYMRERPNVYPWTKLRIRSMQKIRTKYILNNRNN